ncbi:hypothetical protein [Pinibacter aurantiacus]|uniref:Uncharacterized protein n=1 Tax=Pinibacter aurantiacus TaxID=2851599 RepID=A0A9E2SEF1_9BACT|nr:hypothetical protein [Pinibacter aurantiacus]MBV4360597.1 hypothetical protein [Pinibacter aurantiacus]
MKFEITHIKKGDRRIFSITQMVYNISLSLVNERSAKEAYEGLLKNVERYNAHEWLAFAQQGFSGNKESTSRMLAHMLYIVLLEIRTKAYESGDNKTFYIAGMLHNVPSRVLDENEAKEAYAELLKSVKHYNMQAWLDTVQNGFSESS